MDNIAGILNAEGEVFLGVLKDAGVFKDTLQGGAAFKRFRDVLFLNKKAN